MSTYAYTHINREPVEATINEFGETVLKLGDYCTLFIQPHRVQEVITALQSTQPKEIEAIRQARFVTTGDLGRDEE